MENTNAKQLLKREANFEAKKYTKNDMNRHES